MEGYKIPPRGGFAEFSLLHQHVSKCHSHILPEPSAILFLLQRVCPDISEIGLCEVTLPQQTFQKPNALHTQVPGCEGRSKRASNGSGTVQHSCRFLHSSASSCGPQMMEWEDFLSVQLHQLDFNEAVGRVQVPAGQ